MTKHSDHLRSLGRAILLAHATLPEAVCAAIIGSSAEGHSDDYSDLDMAMYYRVLPSLRQMEEARAKIPQAGPIIWTIGDPNDGEFAHAFKIDGIECQISHITAAKWEADIERLLAGEDPGSPSHKALSGTMVAIPITGEALMKKWQTRIREYPDALAEAMVKHHLRFFPMWSMHQRFDRRDANLWIRQSMVESSFNILGVLAGVNRKFFTSFQFKRAKSFIDTLKIAPKNLHARLDAIWNVDVATALSDLKNLVRETIELVEQEMPKIDVTAVKKSWGREDKPWELP